MSNLKERRTTLKKEKKKARSPIPFKHFDILNLDGSEEGFEQLVDVLMRLPFNVQKLLSKRRLLFVFTDYIEDDSPHEEYNIVVATYDFAEGMITVADVMETKQDVYDAVLHEIGHHFDAESATTKVMNDIELLERHIDRMMQQKPLFAGDVHLPFARIYQSEKDYHGFNAYIRSSETEFLAQSYADYYQNPKRFASQCPQVTRYIKTCERMMGII